MLNLLLPVIIALQAQAINRSDLMDIVAAATDHAFPSHIMVQGRPVVSRPLYVDRSRTMAAFRPMVADGELQLNGLRRGVFVEARDNAVLCDQNSPKGCVILNDALLVSVVEARRVENGQLLVVVQGEYSAEGYKGARRLQGLRMELFMARTEGRWAVARVGKAIVLN